MPAADLGQGLGLVEECFTFAEGGFGAALFTDAVFEVTVGAFEGFVGAVEFLELFCDADAGGEGFEHDVEVVGVGTEAGHREFVEGFEESLFLAGDGGEEDAAGVGFGGADFGDGEGSEGLTGDGDIGESVVVEQELFRVEGFLDAFGEGCDFGLEDGLGATHGADAEVCLVFFEDETEFEVEGFRGSLDGDFPEGLLVGGVGQGEATEADDAVEDAEFAIPAVSEVDEGLLGGQEFSDGAAEFVFRFRLPFLVAHDARGCELGPIAICRVLAGWGPSVFGVSSVIAADLFPLFRGSKDGFRRFLWWGG